MSLDDFRLTALLLASTPMAWLMPAALRVRIARLLAGMPVLRPPALDVLPPALADMVGGNTPAAASRVQAAYLEDCLLTLRAWAPWARPPEVALHGAAHLEAAIAAGRGAILWVGDLFFAPLVAKLALHQAGFEVVHLSRPEHRFSGTGYGRRVLNPIQTRIEDRYLRERVVFEGTGAGALTRLRQRLAGGGVVSITAGGPSAERVRVPFMGGSLALPAGALYLGYRTGAPVLPLFLERPEHDRFACYLHEPLVLDRRTSPADAYLCAGTRFAELLERHLTKCPELWAGWQRHA